MRIGQEYLEESNSIAVIVKHNSVIEAIERQMYHYAYHVGQIVYIAKQIKAHEWQTLTFPRKKPKLGDRTAP